MKNIGIIGCGWLGKRIAQYFKNDFKIFSTTTSISKMEEFKNEGFNPTLIRFENTHQNIKVWDKIGEIDVLIIAVPLSLRRENSEHLIQKIQNIISFIDRFHKQAFLISSTGVYPQEYQTFQESDLDSDDVITERFFKDKIPQINILRLGGLMGDNRLLKNYQPQNLDEVVNHIHYHDICRALKLMMEKEVTNELFNIVAPMHPTKLEVIQFQNNENSNNSLIIEKPQRIILSDKIQKQLKFEFKFPNPKFFH